MEPHFYELQQLLNFIGSMKLQNGEDLVVIGDYFFLIY